MKPMEGERYMEEKSTEEDKTTYYQSNIYIFT
jgi:hypothetical protein